MEPWRALLIRSMGLTMWRWRYVRALCTDIRAAGHTSLREANCRQAAHAALEKLDRMSHVHFSNSEELACLRLEIDQDDALTTFEVRARGAET